MARSKGQVKLIVTIPPTSSPYSDLTDVLRPNRRHWFLEFVVRLFRDKPLGAAGLVVVVLLGLMAVFADIVTPYAYDEQILADSLEGYSWRHFLGTDQMGRDLFSRVIYGARISLIVGISCVLASTSTAVLFGVLSGYLGGIVDTVSQRFVDAL